MGRSTKNQRQNQRYTFIGIITGSQKTHKHGTHENSSTCIAYNSGYMYVAL